MRFGLASESRASKSSLTTVFLPIGGHGRLHEGCAQGEGCITGASRGQQNREPVDADVRSPSSIAYPRSRVASSLARSWSVVVTDLAVQDCIDSGLRSEERRVGEESRPWW